MNNIWSTIKIVFFITIALLLIAYTVYCVIHEGTHIRGIGWALKYQYPILYYVSLLANITIILLIVFYVSKIWNY